MNKTLNGLNETEVLASRNAYGSNALEKQESNSFLKKLVKNFGDPIIKILIVAFFITLLFSGEGGGFEALGIAVSILISTLVSTLGEFGSEKAFRKMQNEAKRQTCTVIRSGVAVTVSVDEIVVGDFVKISAGDRMGADGILINGELSCDMSALNGESIEQRKSSASENTLLGTPTDEHSLFRGALITSGYGVMLVRAVGKDTFYGKIAGEIQSENGESPLRERLTRLAGTISKFGYFCAACVALAHLISAFLLDGSFVFNARNVALELLNALTLAVSVVVVAVPEGLPMMITVVLSSNMIRMQKQGIRVRRPVGIEAAGNTQILFTDKTGTLTYGNPKVASYLSGEIARSKRSVDMGNELRFLLGVCAVYGGDSKIDVAKRVAVSGNATDKAVLDEYLSCSKISRGCNQTAYMPFDSRIKLSGAQVDISANKEMSRHYGNKITLIKGAPEIVIKHCFETYGYDGKRKKLNKNALLEELSRLSAKGMRAVAIATSEAEGEALEYAAKQIAQGDAPSIDGIIKAGCLVCIVLIRDEVRREAPRAIKNLKNAGVQPIMITGDSLATAKAIARETGILINDSDALAIESGDLKNMTDEEIAKALPSLCVVARALPDDKSRLVRIAKACGYVTAMTGDGLNDAPALKIADVGFAMGNGTDVTKEAGDIIINNNDISSIERAVLYGRTIFRSIRKFIVFQLIMNLSAVGISIIGSFIGFENPVTVSQMLWINLIMDTLAAIAFAGEAPLRCYMKEPPSKRDEHVLNGDMLTRIFVMGVYTVMLCLYFYNSPKMLSLFGGRFTPAFYSGFFALFVFCGIFGAINARSGRVNVFSGLLQNPVFTVVMSAVFGAQVIMIYKGGELFRCAPLTVEQFKSTVILALTVIPFGIFIEIIMKITSQRKK